MTFITDNYYIIVLILSYYSLILIEICPYHLLCANNALIMSLDG
jgi:hypothetical protein